MKVEDAIRQLADSPDTSALVHLVYADGDVMHAALRFARGEEFQAVASWATCAGTTPPARVLDLGAGRGIASLAWALRGYEVTALEPDPSELVGAGAIRQLVEVTGVPITVVEAMGERLPFANGSFDLVYVRQTMHHASDLQQMCNEIARVLKPRGVCIATREHVVSNKTQLSKFLANHPVHRLAGGEMAYSLRHYKAAFRNAGLRLSGVFGPFQSPANYYPNSTAEVRLRAANAAVRLLGRRVGAFVDGVPLYYRIWTYLASALNRDPGRLYSFVARK